MVGTYRLISRISMDENIIERNVLAADEEIRPARRIQLLDPFDGHPRRIVRREQNRSIENIVRVEDLSPSELVVPALAVAVQYPRPKDLDVFSAPHPECDGLLKIEVEVVRLPVGDVVCELFSNISCLVPQLLILAITTTTTTTRR